MNICPTQFRLRASKILIYFIAWLLVSPVAAMEAKAIGEIKLMIGVSAWTLQSGSQNKITLGMDVFQGQTIVTGEKTHLHLWMKDGAKVVLRPGSKLYIECYEVENDGCLKFELLKGEMRHVTGDYGKENKDRFRLNTPVAAIGIRGTDFVTTVVDGQTFLRVIEGEIVASPFTKECKKDNLGACKDAFSQSLKQSDDFILRVVANQAPQKILFAASRFKGGVNLSSINSSVSDVSILADNPGEVWRFVADQQSDNLALSIPDELVFASWSNQEAGILKPYDVARQEREVTVGGYSSALWRTAGVYPVHLGVVEYNIKSSQANLINPQVSVLPILVESGHLRIDFNQSSLSTRLTVLDGSDRFSIGAEGAIVRSDGIFVLPTEQGGKVAGAISNTAREVGYYLQQPINAKVIDAKVLWNAR